MKQKRLTESGKARLNGTDRRLNMGDDFFDIIVPIIVSVLTVILLRATHIL